MYLVGNNIYILGYLCKYLCMSRYECLQAETSTPFNYSYIRKITKIRYCFFSLELNRGQRDFPILSILSFQNDAKNYNDLVKTSDKTLINPSHDLITSSVSKSIPLGLITSIGKNVALPKRLSFKYAALPGRSKNTSTFSRLQKKQTLKSVCPSSVFSSKYQVET